MYVYEKVQKTPLYVSNINQCFTYIDTLHTIYWHSNIKKSEM